MRGGESGQRWSAALPAEGDRNDGAGQRLLGGGEVNRRRQREEQRECGRRRCAPVENDLAQRAGGRTIAPDVFRGIFVAGGRDGRRLGFSPCEVTDRGGSLGMIDVNVRLGDKALNRARQKTQQGRRDSQARMGSQCLEKGCVHEHSSSVDVKPSALLECRIFTFGRLRRP